MTAISEIIDRPLDSTESRRATPVPRIRAGFVGGGFMAEVHSRAARAAGAELTAISSSSPDRAEAAARRLGVQRWAHANDDVILADDVDVVHICTPNAQHAAQAIAAQRAGKFVICEKPLATTVADARAVVEAGGVGAVPFVYRYHPIVRHARERIANGDVGTILTLEGSYLQDWLADAEDRNWRTDAAVGGSSRAFADIGSHLCDLLEFVTGRRIRALSARTRTVYAERDGDAVANEDIAALVVELDDGALGTLLISQMAPGRKNGLVLELHGTRESVRFAQERPEELWIGRRTGSELLLRDPGMLGDRGLSHLPAGHSLGYQDAFTAFVADAYVAARGATPEGMPTLADGLRAVLLTDAVLRSAKTREWMEVEG